MNHLNRGPNSAPGSLSRLTLAVSWLLIAAPVFAAAESRSIEAMWQLLQAQQAEIRALQDELAANMRRLDQAHVLLGRNADAIRQDRAELEMNRTGLQATNAMLEATATALEDGLEGGSSPGLGLGGYGETHYNNLDSGNEIDLHRFVLFFGYEFAENLNFYAELEVEHDIAGDGKVGEVEIEQAFLQWDYADGHNLKAGVFLLPVGILNETHEPDTFYGVERNPLEKNVIPSTWWEAGLAASGELSLGWHYDVALHSGLLLDAGNASAANRTNLRRARQKAGKANARNLAATARVRYSGIPGFHWGLTLQYQDDLTMSDSAGVGVSDLGALLIETDISVQRAGFAFRGVYGRWRIDDDIELLNVGANRQEGWYLEPSYKLNDKFGVFARYSSYDLTASDGDDSDRNQFDLGFSYWLHPQLVLKADIQRQKNDAAPDTDGFNLGVGYSF